MNRARLHFLFYSIAVLIGAAMFYIRFISEKFVVGTTTFEHPYISFVFALMAAGLVWTGLIWLIPKLAKTGNIKRLLLLAIGLGIGFRILFLGSTPIYENDWNRYLWDGAVVAEGLNPYAHAPLDVLDATPGSSPDLIQLKQLSDANGGFAGRINYADLTTIYPPLAQAVFAIGALIKPFDLNVLRGLFLVVEIVTICLLIKALAAFGRSPLWAVLYALNPLLIYSGFNAVHMDVLLPPFLLGALLLVKTRPYWAAVALAMAGAVKLWPLLLAPVLFRSWRGNFKAYALAAIITGGLFLILTAPLLLSLGENSGLTVYSGNWQRNSFLFSHLQSALGLVVGSPEFLSRLFVASVVTVTALWFGFKKEIAIETLPAALLVVTAALFLLAPTGYPWYALWVVVFLPFRPSYGLALLCATLPLYYTRYALADQDLQSVYTNFIIPVQFGLPIMILIAEWLRARRQNA